MIFLSKRIRCGLYRIAEMIQHNVNQMKPRYLPPGLFVDDEVDGCVGEDPFVKIGGGLGT